MKIISLFIIFLIGIVKSFAQNIDWTHQSKSIVLTDTANNTWFLNGGYPSYYLLEQYGPNDIFIDRDTLNFSWVDIDYIQTSKHSSFFIWGHSLDSTLQLGNYNVGAGLFIAELDYNMNWVSAAHVSTTIYNENDFNFDEAGNLYIAGHYRVSNFIFVTYFWKLDIQGNLIWVKSGVQSSQNMGYFIQSKSNGNCYASSTEVFLEELDTNGNSIWSVPGNGSFFSSMAIDKSDNLYFTGLATTGINLQLGTFFLDGSGLPHERSHFVAKMDAAHNFLWVQQFGGSLYLMTPRLGKQVDDRLYLSCLGSPNNDTLFSNIPYYTGKKENLFFISMNTNGNVNWITPLGCSNNIYTDKLVSNKNREIFNSGTFEGTLFSNPVLYSGGASSDYTIKISDQYSYIDDLYSTNFKIYPNPANKLITIEFPEGNNFEIRLINSLGTLVDKFIAQKKTLEIPINSLPQGLYFLSATSNDNTNFCKKVLILHNQ